MAENSEAIKGNQNKVRPSHGQNSRNQNHRSLSDMNRNNSHSNVNTQNRRNASTNHSQIRNGYLQSQPSQVSGQNSHPVNQGETIKRNSSPTPIANHPYGSTSARPNLNTQADQQHQMVHGPFIQPQLTQLPQNTTCLPPGFATEHNRNTQEAQINGGSQLNTSSIQNHIPASDNTSRAINSSTVQQLSSESGRQAPTQRSPLIHNSNQQNNHPNPQLPRQINYVQNSSNSGVRNSQHPNMPVNAQPQTEIQQMHPLPNAIRSTNSKDSPRLIHHSEPQRANSDNIPVGSHPVHAPNRPLEAKQKQQAPPITTSAPQRSNHSNNANIAPIPLTAITDTITTSTTTTNNNSTTLTTNYNNSNSGSSSNIDNNTNTSSLPNSLPTTAHYFSPQSRKKNVSNLPTSSLTSNQNLTNNSPKTSLQQIQQVTSLPTSTTSKASCAIVDDNAENRVLDTDNENIAAHETSSDSNQTHPYISSNHNISAPFDEHANAHLYPNVPTMMGPTANNMMQFPMFHNPWSMYSMPYMPFYPFSPFHSQYISMLNAQAQSQMQQEANFSKEDNQHINQEDHYDQSDLTRTQMNENIDESIHQDDDDAHNEDVGDRNSIASNNESIEDDPTEDLRETNSPASNTEENPQNPAASKLSTPPPKVSNDSSSGFDNSPLQPPSSNGQGNTLANCIIFPWPNVNQGSPNQLLAEPGIISSAVMEANASDSQQSGPHFRMQFGNPSSPPNNGTHPKNATAQPNFSVPSSTNNASQGSCSEPVSSATTTGTSTETPNDMQEVDTTGETRKQEKASCTSECSSEEDIQSVDQNHVTLEVGGRIFNIHASTFSQFPESRIYRILQYTEPWIQNREGSFTFDRDGLLFEVILSFARSGRLSIPPYYSISAIENEADYFGMKEYMFGENSKNALSPGTFLSFKRTQTLNMELQNTNDRQFQCIAVMGSLDYLTFESVVCEGVCHLLMEAVDLSGNLIGRKIIYDTQDLNAWRGTQHSYDKKPVTVYLILIRKPQPQGSGALPTPCKATISYSTVFTFNTDSHLPGFYR